MKKVKISPKAGLKTANELREKFERLNANVGDNGLTPNFQYSLLVGAYDTKSGINPQTKQAVDYPIIKAVKIGAKSGKINGIADLSINSMKRTINIDDSTMDVIDFTSILSDVSELNALQALESLDESKMFAIVPNGTVLASTNFDATIRPRQLYKVIELADAAKVTEILAAAKAAGLIE